LQNGKQKKFEYTVIMYTFTSATTFKNFLFLKSMSKLQIRVYIDITELDN